MVWPRAHSSCLGKQLRLWAMQDWQVSCPGKRRVNGSCCAASIFLHDPWPWQRPEPGSVQLLQGQLGLTVKRVSRSRTVAQPLVQRGIPIGPPFQPLREMPPRSALAIAERQALRTWAVHTRPQGTTGRLVFRLCSLLCAFEVCDYQVNLMTQF